MNRVIPISSCASAWGMCMRDPRCSDLNCEGHPALSCSTCNGGPCPTPQACHVPMERTRQEPRSVLRLPSSVAFRVGAALALAGALLFALEGLRWLIQLT